MNVGMVCWALIGGQGRYRLATMIFSACTLLITLPIAFCLTLAMRYNLKGLTFAVVVGYSTTAMCLTYVLLMSNWEKISLKVQSKSKVDDDEYSDSMSTEGSSESEDEGKAHPAYEMSLPGSEVAADEGSSTFYINAQPLASPTNQERPREQPGIMKKVFGHLNSRVAKLEDKESQYAQTPQSGVRSIIRTEPLSLNFAKPSKGKKRGGYRAQLILDKSPKKASELYEL